MNAGKDYYSILGVMPDAEGPGKPSIYFAMRVTP